MKAEGTMSEDQNVRTVFVIRRYAAFEKGAPAQFNKVETLCRHGWVEGRCGPKGSGRHWDTVEQANMWLLHDGSRYRDSRVFVAPVRVRRIPKRCWVVMDLSGEFLHKDISVWRQPQFMTRDEAMNTLKATFKLGFSAYKRKPSSK